jgi:hypothetical protein
MPDLFWVKSTDNLWLGLHRVNLSTVRTFGVYVIWRGGKNPWTVRVGQGDIADRLICHRTDAEVQAYNADGLWVTWAAVPPLMADGVEHYLANRLGPLVGTRYPVIPKRCRFL